MSSNIDLNLTKCQNKHMTTEKLLTRYGYDYILNRKDVELDQKTELVTLTIKNLTEPIFQILAN